LSRGKRLQQIGPAKKSSKVSGTLVEQENGDISFKRSNQTTWGTHRGEYGPGHRM